MYRTSLPPSPDSPDIAAAWARGIAAAEQPALCDRAARLARELVALAVQRTPAGEQINAELTISDDAMRIEVHDPSGVQASDGMAAVSTITSTFGSKAGPDGHLVWAEVAVS